MNEQMHQSAHRALSAGKYDVALREYQLLAERGSSNAWISLGWMHQHAAGTPKDLAMAEDCFRKAASLGDVTGVFHLARLFKEGGKHEAAFANFLSAAVREHLPSTYWTGSCYLLGEGVQRDYMKAELYLKRAADQGHIFARRDLNLARLRGKFGKQNSASAIKGWISALLAAPKVAKTNPDSELLQ